MNDWLVTAKQLPIAFSQVREDALLDQHIITHLGHNLSVLCIASGGCTASLIATCPQISRLHLVDMNNAQIALCKLKLKLLNSCDKHERLAVLGHTSMLPGDRQVVIDECLADSSDPNDILGPPDLVAAMGLDHIGRYEFLFAALRNALGKTVYSLGKCIEHDLVPEKQTSDVLRIGFETVMALPNLITLFGQEATQNSVKSFSQHFFEQTLHAFKNSDLRASDNPYLQQVLLGTFQGDTCYPWINEERLSGLPDIQYTHGSMLDALKSSQHDYNFIHLSNILDWLSAAQARQLLDGACAKLKKGGCIFIRQLNSNLNIPALCPSLVFEQTYAARLLARDRSFFYRQLHVGFKR